MGVFLPACGDAVAKVFGDESPEKWVVLGYEGQKLTPQKCGTGELAECTQTFDDAQVQYAFVRIEKSDDGGDAKKIKFVFITWVGESAPAMKKGKVNHHKGDVLELFKGTHVEKAIYERDELDGLAAELDALLTKAGGANYDLGNARSGVKAGQSASYKATSKAFFEQKDKETEVKFNFVKPTVKKGLTPCDLSGRKMVANASDARKNTIGYDSAPSAVLAAKNGEVVKETTKPAKPETPAKPEAAKPVTPAKPVSEPEPQVPEPEPQVPEPEPQVPEPSPAKEEEPAAPAAKEEEPAAPAKEGEFDFFEKDAPAEGDGPPTEPAAE